MKYLKSKTMLFALALAVLGVFESQLGVISQFMSKETFGLFSIGVSVAVAVLRVLTNCPLSDK